MRFKKARRARSSIFDTDELLTADPASDQEHDESQWRGFEASPISLARRIEHQFDAAYAIFGSLTHGLSWEA